MPRRRALSAGPSGARDACEKQLSRTLHRQARAVALARADRTAALIASHLTTRRPYWPEAGPVDKPQPSPRESLGLSLRDLPAGIEGSMLTGMAVCWCPR